MGHGLPLLCRIIALRNEKGSYNSNASRLNAMSIIALRNEKGSYNSNASRLNAMSIIALRNEKGVITIQYKFII